MKMKEINKLIKKQGGPQGWVLSHLLYFLFTHDCMARNDSNTIITFAWRHNSGRPDNRQRWDLAVCCLDYNLSVNMIKTKEIIVDYRNRRTEHAPILIDEAVVEQVKSLMFLIVHVTNKL